MHKGTSVLRSGYLIDRGSIVQALAYFQNGKMSSSPAKAPRRRRTTSQSARDALKEERESIVLWRKPFTTINYSARELVLTLIEWAQQ